MKNSLLKKLGILGATLFTLNTANAQFNCGDVLIDSRDSKAYNTVQIGSQCWMQENLNIGTQVTSINTGSPHSDQFNNGIIEKYCYNNNSTNCNIYGGLYEWDEMMQYNPSDDSTIGTTQGICPVGWHLPTAWEQYALINYVDTEMGSLGNAGDKLKTAADCFGGIDCGISGFNGLLAGTRDYRGYFVNTDPDLGPFGVFWSSAGWSNGNFSFLALNSNLTGIDEMAYTFGNSVRCIKDCIILNSPDTINGSINVPFEQTNVNYTTPLVSGATSYSWTTPSDAIITSGQGTNNIVVNFGSASGNICVSANNNCGNSLEKCLTVTVEPAPPPVIICGTDSIQDGSGNIYKTIQIGTQWWMTKNLNYNTGNSLCYDNSQSNCDIYGRLYDWVTATQACPTGWHLPSDTEWATLTNYLGGQNIAGGKLKEVDTTHWEFPNNSATNEVCFTALPGGYGSNTNFFFELGSGAYFWSATKKINTSLSLIKFIKSDSPYFFPGNTEPSSKFSVRCIKGETTGQRELNQNLNLELFHSYPNPTNSSLTIPYSTSKYENLSLTISDKLGRKLETITKESTGKNNFNLDISKYSSGIYFYNLITETGNSKAGKFVKE